MPLGSVRINSERLRILRNSAALSHQDIANRCGISRQTSTRIETLGVAMPSTIERIALVLGVETEVLYAE
jgi:transcriptional regulator with XRE-family HTH domain